uniref:Uncharacterized protein n=1 Tax=Arundo donax TaxID=35708 RepID=A0A0A9F6X2_ARUDO
MHYSLYYLLLVVQVSKNTFENYFSNYMLVQI